MRPQLLWAALWVLAGCAPASHAGSPPARGPTPDDEGEVHGLVLSQHDSKPLPGATVVIGETRVVSGPDGRFAVPAVPRVYGVAIIGPGRSDITIYTSLTVRDPVVVVGKGEEGAKETLAANAADVSGVLSGGGEYPVSPSVDVSVTPALWTAVPSFTQRGDAAGGPGFGPLHVTWNGPSLLAADVFARRGGPPSSLPAFCAHASAALRAGSSSAVALEFSAARVMTRPAVRLGYPEGLADMPTLHDLYRRHGLAVLRGNDPSFEHGYDAVDFSECGAELCTEAFTYSPYLHASVGSCGPVSASPVTLTLRPAPTFSAPTPHTLARVGLEFAWSALPGAVYELTLADYETSPPPGAPTIHVITASPSTVWPDLSAYGIALPLPPKVYTATVAAYGEYASLDALVSGSARDALEQAVVLE